MKWLGVRVYSLCIKVVGSGLGSSNYGFDTGLFMVCTRVDRRNRYASMLKNVQQATLSVILPL